jgi:preprotein translocase subunit SecG
MLTTVLLVLLILDCFVLVAAVLLQSGKGSGIAASFGGVSSSPDAFIGTRQAGNLLTKISWWSGGIFIAISFILQIASVHTRTPKSVLEQGLTPPPAAPAPTNPNSTAPALPFQPSPTTPPTSGAPTKSGGAPTSPAPKGAAPTPK